MKKSVLLLTLCLFSVRAFSLIDTVRSEYSIDLSAPLPDDAPASPNRLQFNKVVDFSIILPATVWTIYAFPKIYSKPNIDSSVLAGLRKENIPSFDRWAVRHSDKADEVSNYAFYGAMPYPVVLFLDKDIRRDAGRVSGLYWEAMAITGLLYTGGDYFIDRYRPETYDESKPFGDRQSGNEKNSFFAGHVALVATSTFFTASVYDIYHPTSKLKWGFYGVAAVATGATIYLRHAAGKHFPSDLLVGTIIGMGSGMLVPRLHRYKANKRTGWNFSPTIGNGYGVAATLRF